MVSLHWPPTGDGAVQQLPPSGFWDFIVYHHRTSGLLWELCLEPFGYSAVPLTTNTNRSLGGNQNVAGIAAAAAAGIMCGLQPQEDAPHVETG